MNNLQLSIFKEAHERDITPGSKASPTLSVNGFIIGTKTCGISAIILWYSDNSSFSLKISKYNCILTIFSIKYPFLNKVVK